MVAVAGQVRQPPAPGEEAAGPALTNLVRELRESVIGLESLYRQALRTARERYYTGVALDQTDSNGDAVIHLFSVPQGATGHLLLAAVDEAGVTPAAPDTSANLWHAIYAASGPGMERAADVAVVGSLMDCLPTSTTVDAVIPFAYLYGDRYSAPTLVGPQSFYLVIDAATAARQVAVRYGVLVVQPEP